MPLNHDLIAFMGKIGMSDYLGKLEENGIDCYDILRGIYEYMKRSNSQNYNKLE